MSALVKIQRDFCQFIRGHSHRDFYQHIKNSNIPKEDSLSIYLQGIFSTHTEALKNNYPLVFSLLDDRAACEIAHAYIEVNFPCTGDLKEWGGAFPCFIQHYEQQSEWPYLAEVAQYERAKYVALYGSEGSLFTGDKENFLSSIDHKEQTFQFQEACQLIAFLYPLEQIISSIEYNQKSVVPKTQGSSYALIFKLHGKVIVCWLTPSMFVFMNRLKEGQGMDVAFAAAEVLEPLFDIEKAFSFMLSYPLLRIAEK